MVTHGTDGELSEDNAALAVARAFDRADKPNATREDADTSARLLRQHPHVLDKANDLAAVAGLYVIRWP